MVALENRHNSAPTRRRTAYFDQSFAKGRVMRLSQEPQKPRAAGACAPSREPPIRFINIMSLPSVEPPIRLLIRTRPAQLQKVHPSIDQADTELIKKLCDKLSITNYTKISHLITRVSDDKKLERVDIIFDYGSPTIDSQPPVMAYSITIEGPDLIVKQIFHPSIRQIVNHTVKTFESINLENSRCFPSRADTRAETQRQRRAVEAEHINHGPLHTEFGEQGEL